MQFFTLRANPVVLWVVAAGLATGAAVLDWVVLEGFRWQRLAAGFPTAVATVVRSELVERRGGKGGTTYTLELAYQFTVGGQTYVGTRVRYFANPSSKHRAEVERLRAEYHLARQVTAYYPPDNPADAVLRPGVEGTDHLRALFAAGLTVLAGGAARLAFGRQPGFDPTDPAQAPRVLLSTFPGEPHALGLLMVEGWLTLQGAQVINLGAQTPTADLIEACEHHQADVVALSFSASAPAHLVQEALPTFRSRLPARVAVWAGGRNPLLARRAPAGVLVLDDLNSLSRAVHAWHDARVAPGDGSRA